MPTGSRRLGSFLRNSRVDRVQRKTEGLRPTLEIVDHAFSVTAVRLKSKQIQLVIYLQSIGFVFADAKRLFHIDLALCGFRGDGLDRIVTATIRLSRRRCDNAA
jgi:hypothetical protein